MFNRRDPSRPPLPDRHTRLAQLNETIESLEVAYRETRNENVFRALRMLEAIKNDEIKLDELYRSDEIEEFWKNLGLFPHSIKTWFFDYRDNELKS